MTDQEIKAYNQGIQDFNFNPSEHTPEEIAERNNRINKYFDIDVENV